MSDTNGTFYGAKPICGSFEGLLCDGIAPLHAVPRKSKEQSRERLDLEYVNAFRCSQMLRDFGIFKTKDEAVTAASLNAQIGRAFPTKQGQGFDDEIREVMRGQRRPQAPLAWKIGEGLRLLGRPGWSGMLMLYGAGRLADIVGVVDRLAWQPEAFPTRSLVRLVRLFRQFEYYYYASTIELLRMDFVDEIQDRFGIEDPLAAATFAFDSYRMYVRFQINALCDYALVELSPHRLATAWADWDSATRRSEPNDPILYSIWAMCGNVKIPFDERETRMRNSLAAWTWHVARKKQRKDNSARGE